MIRIGRRTVTLAMGCMLGIMAGCDELLEVDLPDAVTEDALDSPDVMPVLVNSVMASVECAYSSMAADASGFEDNFQMYSGVAGQYSQYRDTPGGGACDTDAYSTEWIDPSVIDESRPFDREPSLNLYDPANPNQPPYSAAFVARYREAQLARNRRITDWVWAELDRRRAGGSGALGPVPELALPNSPR